MLFGHRSDVVAGTNVLLRAASISCFATSVITGGDAPPDPPDKTAEDPLMWPTSLHLVEAASRRNDRVGPEVSIAKVDAEDAADSLHRARSQATESVALQNTVCMSSIEVLQPDFSPIVQTTS